MPPTLPLPVARLLRCSLLAGTIAFSGCETISTIESRSKEMSASFDAASPAAQRLIRDGLIERGFSPNLVYIALNRPDKITKTPDGREEVWTYMNFNAATIGSVLGSTKITTTSGPTKSSPTAPGARGTYSNYDTRGDAGSGAAEPVASSLIVTFLDGAASRVELK